MRNRHWVLLAACILLPQLGFGDPSTLPAQPTTTATTHPDLKIDQAYLDLSDPDPKIRATAEVELMGINSSEIQRLQKIVADAPPYSPQVVAALHNIVMHVFLAGYKYTDLNSNDVDSSSSSPYYFLGILWPLGMNDDNRLGAYVDQRLVGFPSYRYLHSGDMIMGIIFDTTESLAVFPNSEIHQPGDLKNAIRGRPDRSSAIFQIVRDGEIIQVPMRMAPRPIEAGPPDPVLNGGPILDYAGQIKGFDARRMMHADEFWHDKFDSIITQIPAD